MEDTYFDQWSSRVQDFLQWAQDQVPRYQDNEGLPSCGRTFQDKHGLYQYAPNETCPNMDE